MQRSKLGATEVQAIMAKQASRATRLAAADDIIVNDTDLATLQQRMRIASALPAAGRIGEIP